MIRIVMSVLTVTAVALAATLGGGHGSVEAQRIEINVVATGAEEVPPVVGTATARARFIYDRDARTLEFAVTVQGLSANLVTAAHIHRGAVGVNGPIVHNLSTVGFTQVAGTINLSAADIADLEAGNFYLNVHSVQHPAGFARAQLFVPATALPTPTPVRTPTVSPPATGDAGLAAESRSSYALLAGALSVTLLTGSLAIGRRAAVRSRVR